MFFIGSNHKSFEILRFWGLCLSDIELYLTGLILLFFEVGEVRLNKRFELLLLFLFY